MKKMIFSIILALLSCSNDDSSKHNSSTVMEDVLYDALLNFDIEAEDFETKSILMNGKSYIPVEANLEKIQKNKKNISEGDSVRLEMIDELLKNQEKVLFKNLSINGIELREGAESDLEILGVLKVSKVFFSDIDNNQGLFYYEFVCGGECGSGNLVFIQLEDGKWEITKHDPLFVM